ncbi:putative phage tail protein [Rhodovulum sp. P5]|uniref:tail length tape measure protein n=1 Tax=Rhodovulum phage vB_RhkS_P1 TaxID=1873452 RepID=UPI00080ABA42|nr:hypothetical protein [Rhodovulum sp. P5]YP_009285932.1 tail length tape measure protein [Rhodovulum phage vB_RhkS_P1]ANT39918.1 putative tail protein [Rhodovulum phage vB_RhkS_P1]ARE38986.1 putative phage tail protein [Rhodovulum sp. P5]
MSAEMRAALVVEADASAIRGATREVEAGLKKMTGAAGTTERKVAGLNRAAVQTAGAQARMGTGAGAASRAIGALGVSASNAQQGLRMLPFQLNQIAQSGAVTGRWMTAVTTQIPDILAGFGSMPLVLAGGAAAMGAVLIPALIGGRDAVRDFDEAMDHVAATTEMLQAPLDVLAMSVDELRAKYGAAAETVRAFALAQAEIAAAQAERRLRDQVAILDDVIDRYTLVVTKGRTKQTAVAAIASDFGLSTMKAREFQDVLQAVSSQMSGSFDEQQAALSAILAYLEAQGVSLKDIPPELQSALSEMIEFARETEAARELAKQVADASASITFDPAAQSAARLAEQLGISAALAARLAQNGLGGAEDPVVFDPRDPRYDPVKAEFARVQAEAQRVNSWASGTGTRTSISRAGGGGSTATADARAAERLLEQAKTAADRYADSLAEVNRLREAGYLSDLEAEQVLGSLADRYAEAGAAGVDMAQEISSAITGLIFQTQTLDDVLRSVAQTLVRSGINWGVEALIGQFSGGSAASAGSAGSITQLFPGRAGGGPVSAGSTYWVGENGPELLTMGQSGYVTPNHALQSAAPRMEVHVNNYAGAEVSVRQSGGRIDLDIRQAVTDVLRSGGADKAMSARFGMRPRAQGG